MFQQWHVFLSKTKSDVSESHGRDVEPQCGQQNVLQWILYGRYESRVLEILLWEKKFVAENSFELKETMLFITIYTNQSYSPGSCRNEIFSGPQTVGSWIRITLEARMPFCVISVHSLPFVGSGLATGLFPIRRGLLYIGFTNSD
jgi:hypothetical protein